jgi:hypothetical protein
MSGYLPRRLGLRGIVGMIVEGIVGLPIRVMAFQIQKMKWSETLLREQSLPKKGFLLYVVEREVTDRRQVSERRKGNTTYSIVILIIS